LLPDVPAPLRLGGAREPVRFSISVPRLQRERGGPRADGSSGSSPGHLIAGGQKKMTTRITTGMMVLSLVATGCGDSGGTNMGNPDLGFKNVSTENTGSACGAKFVENVSTCMPGMNDYQPRKMMPGSNGWPKCDKIDASPNKWILKGMDQPPATS